MNLCPKCTHRLKHDAMADSGINDQLIKMDSTHSWIKCIFSSSISYFVVCYFWHKIFNTTQLLHHMALSVKLLIKKVINLILIITRYFNNLEHLHSALYTVVRWHKLFVRWTLSVPYIIVLFWLSVCQKLSNLVQIWRSSDKNKLGHFLAHLLYS